MADDQVIERVRPEPEVTVRDALDDVRTATQQLHSAIMATLAKRAQATSADVEALARQAKQSAELARSAIGDHYQAAEAEIRKRLNEAAVKLDAAGRKASDSVQQSGQEFRESLTAALTQARASANDISEAVAAKRAEIAARHNPPLTA